MFFICIGISAPPFYKTDQPITRDPNFFFLIGRPGLYLEVAEASFAGDMVYNCAGISNHPFFSSLEKLNMSRIHIQPDVPNSSLLWIIPDSSWFEFISKITELHGKKLD